MDFLNRDWSVFLDIGFFLLYRDFHYYRKNAAEIFLFTERLPPRAGSLRNLCVVREDAIAVPGVVRPIFFNEEKLMGQFSLPGSLARSGSVPEPISGPCDLLVTFFESHVVSRGGRDSRL